MTNSSPKFDYKLLEGYFPGTEEYGTANVQMQMNFIGDCICWGLSLHVNGQRQGKIPETEGCSQTRLESAAFGMAQIADKDIYEVWTTKGKDGKLVGDLFFGEVLRELVRQNTVIYNSEDGTLMPNFEVEDNDLQGNDDPELNDVVIDGMSFPYSGAFSPERMIELSKNEALFRAMYPDGKFELVVTTAKLLQEGKVHATKHKVGENDTYFYTAKLR